MPEETNQNIDDNYTLSHLIDEDTLPVSIRQSSILTPFNLRQLAAVRETPFIDPTFHNERLKNIIQYYSINPDEMEKELHIFAKELLDESKVSEAWQVLLTGL